MNLFLLITLLWLITFIRSERLLLDNLNNITPHETRNIEDSASIVNSVLSQLSSQIQQLSWYNGLFTANCTFLPNTSYCDIIEGETKDFTSVVEITQSIELSEQILRSNILFATIYADWTRGKKQEILIDLFLKQNTCSKSLSISETSNSTYTNSPTVLDTSKTHSIPLYPDKKESFSESATFRKTKSLMKKSHTSNETLSQSFGKTKSLTEKSHTSNETRSQSFSKRLSESHSSQTFSISYNKSKTSTFSLSEMESISNETTKSRTESLTRKSGLLTAWNYTKGAFQDATNQPGRYRVANGVVNDTATGLQWEQSASGSMMTWDQAVQYCELRTTGGYNDWQLPDIAELQSLVDYTISSAPYMDLTVFPGSPSNNFWSNTPDLGNPGSSWYIQFNYYGCNNHQTLSSTAFIRCVRTINNEPPTDRYQVSNGVVIDIVTGLHWQRTITSGKITWANANGYCDNLNLEGQAWRVPTVHELSTLLDYSVVEGNLMMDQFAFSGEPIDYFWTSTGVASSSGNSWYVSFKLGYIGISVVGDFYYVRRVRTPPQLLSAWNAMSGVYQDATNQTNRYSIGSSIATDLLTGIQWQQTASSLAYNWSASGDYCTSQTTGGYTDWRLPNIVELQIIVDYTMGAPYLNAGAFPGALSAINYWSSTFVQGGSNDGFYLWLSDNGVADTQTITTKSYVFCVRSLYPTPPTSRYKNASGVVIDMITGLLWQQLSTGGNMTQPISTTHCSSLNLGGISSEWRLASAKELASIVDFSINGGNLMMDSTVFLGEPLAGFWSSTQTTGITYSWELNSQAGTIYYDLTGGSHLAKCVHSPSGLFAIWNQESGVYNDTTNQPGRYIISSVGQMATVNDTFSGLQWQRYPSPNQMNWWDAQGYCWNLGDDWRLPNVIELQTLIDYTINYVISTPINPIVFPGTSKIIFWTSTPEAGYIGSGWMAGFDSYGATYQQTIGTTSAVRCVRSSYSLQQIPRYTILLGEITDIVTKLVWQKVSTAGLTNWTNALSHCSNLGLNNRKWRLPTIKELATLVDYSVSYSNLMMDNSFAGETIAYYWSSTTLGYQPTDIMGIDFYWGHAITEVVDSNAYVRCVYS